MITLETKLIVRCDGVDCDGEGAFSSTTIYEATKLAKKSGWSIPPKRNYAYCYDCNEEIKLQNKGGKFTTEQDQMIIDAFPDNVVIKGKSKVSVYRRTKALGLQRTPAQIRANNKKATKRIRNTPVGRKDGSKADKVLTEKRTEELAKYFNHRYN